MARTALVGTVAAIALAGCSSSAPAGSGRHLFASQAAICGAPKNPPISISTAGSRVEIRAVFKPQVTNQERVHFEIEEFDARVGDCFAYLKNVEVRGKAELEVFGTPRQIRLYQGFIEYFLNGTNYFESVYVYRFKKT